MIKTLLRNCKSVLFFIKFLSKIGVNAKFYETDSLKSSGNFLIELKLSKLDESVKS